MKNVIEASAKDAGLRNKVEVLIGGAAEDCVKKHRRNIRGKNMQGMAYKMKTHAKRMGIFCENLTLFSGVDTHLVSSP